MKKQLTARAVFDGIIRAAALFVLIDFAASVCYAAYSTWTAAAAMAAGMVLPAVLAYPSFGKYRSEFKPAKYFLVSGAVFALMLLLIFNSLAMNKNLVTGNS